MFNNDGWAHWHPDPERAFRDHDPTLEPFVSMSREEILAAMLDARGGREWEFLREFLLDKCSPDELSYERFCAILADQGGFGSEELVYLCDQAGLATRLIPPGQDATVCPGNGNSTGLLEAAPAASAPLAGPETPLPDAPHRDDSGRWLAADRD